MSTWTCPNCSEELDADFDRCWNCGTNAAGEPPDEGFETALEETVVPPREGPQLPLTTTPGFQGQRIIEYRGLVFGEAIIGANVLSDAAAGVRDVVGGRSASYERKLSQAREHALTGLRHRASALGGTAVVGVSLDYEVIRGGMLMVVASGTAVVSHDDDALPPPTPGASGLTPQGSSGQ